MRIRQLASNYHLSIQELTEYLVKLEIPSQSLHPNAKLNNDTIEKIVAYFELKPLDSEEDLKKDTELDQLKDVEKNKEKKIVTIKESKVVEEHSLIESGTKENDLSEGTPVEATDPKEDGVILSDQLLEIIESEEILTDLQKIKLIKAPKKELAGLKVLGKIEIPEDPRRKNKKKETEWSAVDPEQKQKLEEKKENKRVRAKIKKEAYEERQTKKEKDKERARRKNLKKAYYRERLSKKNTHSAPTKQHKPNRKAYLTTEEGETKEKSIQQKKQPKTVFGKFWQWLNSSGYE